MANVLTPFCNWVAKNYGDNVGKMLIHTGVVGWVLSSAAQVVAIMINDKIPKEQKMYMIPQEIADAGINIISFYLVTQTFKGLASKYVDMGRLLPKSVRDFLKSNKIENVGKKGFDVLTQGNLTPEISKGFTEFRNGIDVIGTTIGSILSCNIITPLLRNEIAANRQKRSLASVENNPKPDSSIFNNNSQTPYFNRPSMGTFINNPKYQTNIYSGSYSLKI